MANILVPDYLGRHVRDGIRALQKQGDKIDLAWTGVPSSKSVYIRKIFSVTPSDENDEKYIEDVISLYKRNSYDLILPFGNASYYAVSKHSDRLNSHNIRFMAPDYETFRIAHDKFKMTQFCKVHGFDTPVLFTDYAQNDINAIANQVQYPVVIKAKSGAGVSTGLRYANNKQELIRFYEEVGSFKAKTGASNFQSPMIQEFIPGFLHDACTLTNSGHVVAILTQRRHLTYPIYGGVGAVNVTTDDKKLSGLARQLLEAIKWHGPAQIEFKYDDRDKKYKLIEMNPKLWGTLDLSIRAGVNFPSMIRDIILEKKINPPVRYSAGIRYKFLFPQATIAYCQMIRALGIKSIFDPQKYKNTFYDIDSKDWKFDFNAIVDTGRTILAGYISSPHSNLGSRFVNRLSLN